MDIERKALYNILRMNHLNGVSAKAEAWQLLDYRQLNDEELFQRLSQLGVEWDKRTFLSYASDLQSPEEMSTILQVDEEDQGWHDEIFLNIFELWRRFLPAKQSLSIFCDELDFQINAYDSGSANQQELQEMFVQLQQILEDYLDEGENPSKVFQALQRYCGNDIESFLNDYISEQIDGENFGVAQELIEGFQPFLSKSLWLELFSLRVMAYHSPSESRQALKEFVKKLSKEDNLELYFETLNHMIQNSEPLVFFQLVKRVPSLIKNEEDFQELLAICRDYFEVTDQEERCASLDHLIQNRQHLPSQQPFSQNDESVLQLLKLLEHSLSIS